VNIPNIGPGGRRRRLIFGVVWLGVAAFLTAVVLLDRPSIVRGIVFVPLWLGTLGIFQALDKT